MSHSDNPLLEHYGLASPSDFYRRKQFLLSGLYEIQIPSGIPTSTDFFGVAVEMDSTNFNFNFAYNRITGFYSVNILRNGVRLLKTYLSGSEQIDIPNMNQSNAVAPDGRIGIVDVGNVGDVITPESLSEGDRKLVVLFGKFIKPRLKIVSSQEELGL